MTRLHPDIMVPWSCSVVEALRRLNETQVGILLVVDESGILQRTVTDGDLRRLLIAEKDLNTTLASLPQKAPVVAHPGQAPEQLLAQMNSAYVNHLPIVDGQGRPVGLVCRQDVDNTILLSTPHVAGDEKTYVDEAFQSNWIAPLGPNVDAFEIEFAAYVGVQGAAAVVSGTAALHLALRLLDIGPGDVVLCSTFTFIASAAPIVYQGAEPVFVDSEPDSWCMSPQALERAIESEKAAGRLPRAVLVANIYGQSADYASILSICDAHGIPVVEDAAESLGATYQGRASGTLGRIGAFSFNGNKIITTSGGGMIVSGDEEIIQRARHLSTQAREPAPYYLHSEIGYNYRMSNILAGIGRGQLRVLDERVAARRRVFARYRDELSDIPSLEWMPEASYGRCTRWLTAGTLVAGGLTPSELIQRLAATNIEARHVWNPLHRQPVFRSSRYYPHRSGFSVADDLFCRGFCLPSSSNLTDEQQARVIHEVRRAVTKNRRA